MDTHYIVSRKFTSTPNKDKTWCFDDYGDAVQRVGFFLGKDPRYTFAERYELRCRIEIVEEQLALSLDDESKLKNKLASLQNRKNKLYEADVYDAWFDQKGNVFAYFFNSIDGDPGYSDDGHDDSGYDDTKYLDCGEYTLEIKKAKIKKAA